MSISRMELLASVSKLIESEGKDEEARNTVAKFACENMKIQGTSAELTTPKLPGTGFSGRTTTGHDVRVGDDDGEKNKTFFFGKDHTLRIGQYILSYYGHSIDIAHFWKHSEGTQSETERPPQWRLGLDADKNPLWFGIRGDLPSHSRGIPFVVKYTTTLSIYKEQWPVPGREHPCQKCTEIALGRR